MDDDRDLQTLISTAVGVLGYADRIYLQGFTNGRSFLNYLNANPSDMDAMIVDGNLGGRPDGVQTAQLAMDINPNLQLIGCSGDIRYNSRFARMGAVMTVLKDNLYPMLPCIFDQVIALSRK